MSPVKAAAGAAILFAGMMLLSLGFLLGLTATGADGSRRSSANLIQQRLTDQDLTNPLLSCEGAEETIGDPMIRPFKTELRGQIDRLVSTGSVKQMAVYFRDLNNGPWHGINEDVLFYPASLMKIPIAMAIMKEAETDPSLLKRRLRNTLARDYNAGMTFGPSLSVPRGRTVTVEKLMELMLTGSDNNAAVLLGESMDSARASKMFADLGLAPPVDAPRDYLSARSYGMFFRILFNASYLTKDASERILALLAGSSFRSGIAAGVSPGIVVANKYGEQELGVRREIKELHDCGIVYYPNSPYLLCIMSKGDSFESDRAAIREVSRFVFTMVDANERGTR